MTLQEARTELVGIYTSKEINDQDIKDQLADVAAELPEDMDAKKIKALMIIAQKEAKNKYKEFSEATTLMSDLIEELEDE